MRQEMMGFWGGSGISWTICKQSAPHSRQITMPTPHHLIFTGRMLFLTPNQQCQSTEGTEGTTRHVIYTSITATLGNKELEVLQWIWELTAISTRRESAAPSE